VHLVGYIIKKADQTFSHGILNTKNASLSYCHCIYVNGGGRKWIQFLPRPCTAHLHNRLLCRHDTDHVSNDEHVESYL